MEPVLPTEIAAAASIEEAAERLGATLGLTGAAPIAATRRALDEPRYARALLATRKLPAIRDRFLAAPGEVAEAQPSSRQVVSKAAGSLLKWGMDGLRPAQPWVIERRLAACAACEFQAPAPDTLVYRGARVAVSRDAKICTVCHCLTNTKAALSTEHCPERDQQNPSLSRWGEPWIPPEDRPQGPW